MALTGEMAAVQTASGAVVGSPMPLSEATSLPCEIGGVDFCVRKLIDIDPFVTRAIQLLPPK